ncbi:hypothetical protein [Francisella frigiditurris]|uniref:Uncharacterized protein n=1 Tax=Francisella frigiditurris TaxID=1542390 RepID=A0A1J0KV63_9GAMM|nr:hypothetical protein [Francisella frigiditurris]APC97677.1 hypothetical protein KX01_1292 [Francisella frigiditurris]
MKNTIEVYLELFSLESEQPIKNIVKLSHLCIDIYPWGFKGEIDAIIFLSLDENIFNKILKHNFSIKLTIKIYNGNGNIKKYSFIGFTYKKIRKVQLKKNKDYLEFKIKIQFKDFLQAVWQNHRILKAYKDKSIYKIISDNLFSYNKCNINDDDNLLQDVNKQIFVVTSKKRSFYDFFVEELKKSNLTFIYNYDDFASEYNLKEGDKEDDDKKIEYTIKRTLDRDFIKNEDYILNKKDKYLYNGPNFKRFMLNLTSDDTNKLDLCDKVESFYKDIYSDIPFIAKNINFSQNNKKYFEKKMILKNQINYQTNFFFNTSLAIKEDFMHSDKIDYFFPIKDKIFINFDPYEYVKFSKRNLTVNNKEKEIVDTICDSYLPQKAKEAYIFKKVVNNKSYAQDVIPKYKKHKPLKVTAEIIASNNKNESIRDYCFFDSNGKKTEFIEQVILLKTNKKINFDEDSISTSLYQVLLPKVVLDNENSSFFAIADSTKMLANSFKPLRENDLVYVEIISPKVLRITKLLHTKVNKQDNKNNYTQYEVFGEKNNNYLEYFSNETESFGLRTERENNDIRELKADSEEFVMRFIDLE